MKPFVGPEAMQAAEVGLISIIPRIAGPQGKGPALSLTKSGPCTSRVQVPLHVTKCRIRVKPQVPVSPPQVSSGLL
jgi:hypothetical protein